MNLNEAFGRITERLTELELTLAQPETLRDLTRSRALLRERAELAPAAEAWTAYQALLRRIADTEQLTAAPEFAALAAEELASLQAERTAAEEALRVLLLPRDPDEERSVVMEIRAGAGGEEAALFAADLMRMYLRYAERCGFRVEAAETNTTPLGGVKEAVFTLSGTKVFSRLRFESGVHRVQRVPVTEAGGRIHTSTCTVAVLPEAEEVDLQIDPKDLRVDVFRSTGHGGQCINTTDSAVRITHLPTGTVVTCQDQKSQLKNRDQAMRVLRARLLEQLRGAQDAAYAARRKSQVGTGDRSERVRTYSFPQNRVTDNRIGLTLYRLDAFLDGDMDEVIDALRAQAQRSRLEAMSRQTNAAGEPERRN